MSIKALQVDQLSVNYDKTPVLWEINLTIPPAKIIGIIGPNGAGKSTLLKAILGLIKPLTGKVEFFGLPLQQARQRLAYVPQRGAVDWDFPLTVRDLVLMGRYGRLGLLRKPRSSDWQAADDYIERVGLTPYRDRQISQLSGGQQQRAFLARALMQEADIYFFDEPFTGIDIASESTLMEILRELRTAGKTIFVVHHDLTTVESYFDWVIMLNMRLVACGPTTQVFNSVTLHSAYGKSYALFDEVLKLSQSKTAGIAL
jgi:manganese/zinc/iron transport system ATP- binding protein